MASNNELRRSTVRWGVRVPFDAKDRLAQLALELNLAPAQIMAMAIESLASGKSSELRTYVLRHADDELALRPEGPWKFDVPAVTVAQVERCVKEFGVSRRVLVTLIIDCLTDGNGNDGNGGKKLSMLEGLLRIIYSAATPSPSVGSSTDSAHEVRTPTA